MGQEIKEKFHIRERGQFIKHRWEQHPPETVGRSQLGHNLAGRVQLLIKSQWRGTTS
jgi:hypothetical protein